ncbi:MAG: NAD(P)H-dependent oxidoreductase, partial [Spirochaetes bacterium]|nr:NAD(P)H-dependent oxidoreductase [Spirochaetota bacterium]
QELREKIALADAVIIGTPEYVFSVPAILKNALEWCVASTVFTDKPTALIVAASAGEKTFEQLSLILKTIQCRIEPGTMLHVKGARTKLQDKELNDQLDRVFYATIALLNGNDTTVTQ